MKNASLSTSINLLLSLAAYVAFIGYTFLTDYYGRFGVRLQSLEFNAEHLLVRGIDLARYDFQLLTLLILLLALAAILELRFSIRVGRRKLDRTVLIFPAVILVFICADFRTSNLARQVAVRDTFSTSSALRQIVCLEIQNEKTTKWISGRAVEEQKILELYRSENILVIFLDPKFKIGEPHVEVFTFKLPSTYVIRDAVASAPIKPDHDATNCFS